MTVAAILLARVSPNWFIGAGVALVGLVAYAAFLWPHAAIVLVVLSPILDRYLVSGLLPLDVLPAANYFSEALLLSVTVALLISAAREDRLVAALRHPVTALLGAFSLLALVSTLVNAVPPHVAILGMVFTLDAAVLFFLPRLVAWSARQVVLAVGAFLAIVVAACLVAVGQALLRPDLLGLFVMTGQFGELYRLAAFIGNPNVLGAFITAAAPFALLAATNLDSVRYRRLAVATAFILMLILWLTFSRGAWLAMAVSIIFVLAWFGRRTLAVSVAILIVSFLTANFMPRDLLLGAGEGGSVRPNVISSTFGRVSAVGEGRDLRTLFVLNGLPIIADHPLIGVGPGRWGGAVAFDYWSPVHDEYGTDEVFDLYPQRTVDNFWLHLLVESGGLGVAAFIGAAAVPGVQILRAGRRATGMDRVLLGGIATATVALAVNSVSTMLLEANSVAFLYWFLLGLGSIAVARVTPAASGSAPDGEDVR